MTIIDELDHTANRVGIAAMVGLGIGGCIGTFRGKPIPRTMLSMATSCTLVATANFVPERLIFHSLAALFFDEGESETAKTSESPSTSASTEATTSGVLAYKDTNSSLQNKLLFSHATGGFVGGSICGLLFQGTPIPSILLFTPLMTGIGYAEDRFQARRRERIDLLYKEVMAEHDGAQEEQGEEARA